MKSTRTGRAKARPAYGKPRAAETGCRFLVPLVSSFVESLYARCLVPPRDRGSTPAGRAGPRLPVGRWTAPPSS